MKYAIKSECLPFRIGGAKAQFTMSIDKYRVYEYTINTHTRQLVGTFIYTDMYKSQLC